MLDEIKRIKSEIWNSFTDQEKKNLKRAVLGIVGAAIIGTITYNAIYNYSHYHVDKKEVEESIWEESATQLKKGHLGLNINFSDIDTTGEVSVTLQQLVDEAADKLSKSYKIENKESQDIEVSSDIPDGYVTVTENKETIEDNKVLNSSQELVKSGQIYFRDGYLGKYVSESGKFEVILGQYDANTDKYIVSQRESLENANKAEFSESLDGVDTECTWESEKTYMTNLESALLGVYSSEWDKNRSDVEEMLDKYFTPDCKNKFISQNSNFDRSIIKDVSMGYFDFGKSNINSSYVDRVYAQINMNVSGEKAYLDLELKINDLGKIFDFDII